MATTPTTGDIPSNAAVDLKFNSEQFDRVMNSDDLTYTDRFGKKRITMKGVQELANGFQDTFTNLLGSPDGFKLIGGVKSFDTLRSTPVRTEGQRIFLKSYYENGTTGGGIFVGHIGTKLDDSGTVAQGVGYYWEREYNNNFYTLEMFGALGDGLADDTIAVKNAFMSKKSLYSYGDKSYRLTSSLIFDAFDVSFVGNGKGKTVFILDHLTTGLKFGPESDVGNDYSLKLENFSVVRPNYLNYTGSAGPKSLYASNRAGGGIKNVSIEGNVGYGIQLDYSTNSEVRRCDVSNSVGGTTNPLTGTDGIHIYRSNKIKVMDNTITGLGDDGLSTGSFDPNYPSTDIEFAGNTIFSSTSGIKCYSYVENVLIHDNIITDVTEGGVYLTNDKNAYNNAYVKNVKIHDNIFINVKPKDTSSGKTNIEVCALRLRMWPDNTVSNSTATISDIYFDRNHVENCGGLVNHLALDNNKRLKNLFIRGNTFEDGAIISTTIRYAIRLLQCDGKLEITGNTFSNIQYGVFSLDYQYTSFNSSGSIAPTISLLNNTINGWSQANTSVSNTARVHLFFFRESGYHLKLNIWGNSSDGYDFSDNVSAPGYGIYTATISPLSFIGPNNLDRSNNIFSTNNCWKGPDKSMSSVPSVGTHYQLSRITSSNGSASTYNIYDCYQSGTYGTLTGVTATSVAGSRSLTVNDSTSLYEGCLIVLAGLSTVFTVMKITGNTVSLDSAVSSSLSGVGVSFSPPKWRILSYSSSTPTTSAM